MFYTQVFEKGMHVRISSFLEGSKVLIQHQTGFRNLCLTLMSLNSSMDELINLFENRDYIIGVFLDFSQVFDTVDLGISFQSYLS